MEDEKAKKKRCQSWGQIKHAESDY